MTIQLKQKINDLVVVVDGYINQINELDVKCDNQHDRIETLDNELAKVISILDKIASGYDYPREHLLAIIDKAKFVLQQD